MTAALSAFILFIRCANDETPRQASAALLTRATQHRHHCHQIFNLTGPSSGNGSRIRSSQ
jgi:hypothetical protein